MFDIHPGYGTANMLQHRYLAGEIIQKGAKVVIADKGLGVFDGIEVIRQVKELSDGNIRTIMVTGEPYTRETHMIADKFMEKRFSREEIHRAVLSLL